jgi:hypothetical protein
MGAPASRYSIEILDSDEHSIISYTPLEQPINTVAVQIEASWKEPVFKISCPPP